MQLSQLELQNLRHMIGSHETAYHKLTTYANQTQDAQLKQMFQNSANEAKATKQKLMSYLG